MPAKRMENREDVVQGVGGSVKPWVKERLYKAASLEGITPSAYIGKVLTEHAMDLPKWEEKDERQVELL